MSQPTPITPELPPPLIVLTTFAGHLAAITSGAEPFGALERPLVAGTDDQAEAPDDSLWPHIPGTGKGGKGGMSDLELGAFFARLVGPESLYHVSTPKGGLRVIIQNLTIAHQPSFCGMIWFLTPIRTHKNGWYVYSTINASRWHARPARCAAARPVLHWRFSHADPCLGGAAGLPPSAAALRRPSAGAARPVV